MLNYFQNIGVAHGQWGEKVASEYLLRNKYEIIAQNVRPVKDDKRLEIDIIAWDDALETLVFIEVKQHSTLTEYSRRLRSITKDKKRNLRIACNAWRRMVKWHGAIRFDVLEIYGEPNGDTPIIDHIRDVELFARRNRFVKWY